MVFWIILATMLSLLNARSWEPREILFVPWGRDSLQTVRYQVDPDGRYGPQSFHVDPADSRIAILDPLNRRIKVYEHDSLTRALQAPRYSKDFVLTAENKYVCLVDNALWRYADQQVAQRYRRKTPLPLIQRIYRQDGQLLIRNHDGTISRLTSQGIQATGQKGLQAGSNYYQASKQSRSLAEVGVRDPQGLQKAAIKLPIPTNNLGSIQVVGVDTLGRIYLDLDLIQQQVPLKVQRELRILSATGETLGTIQVPVHYYTRMFRDLELDPSGKLYQMISSTDGLHVFEWTIPGTIMQPTEGSYPQKYQQTIHYNEAGGGDFQGQRIPPRPEMQSITRDEALAIGDSYVEHQWNCTAANISDGVETAPDGDLVQTPDWIHVGTNQRIPYKWGGFDKLPAYDSGIAEGDYAGDIHTDGVCYNYARGVDCSGFVCRCWKLNTHYSTRMMDDPGSITLAHASWEDLQPADAIHKPGHVRLAISTLQNGVILAVEAAGSSTGWKVDYTSYTLTDLYNYAPRYYKNMTGASVPPAPPVLSHITQPDSLQLKWELISTLNTDGVHISVSENMADWTTLFKDSLFAVTQTSLSVDLGDAAPHFFKLKAVNTGEDTTLSFPTDTYGVFQGGSCGEQVLIVDGFDRTESSGSWHLPYHSFAAWLGQALAAMNVSFATAANEALLNGQLDLHDYAAVCWLLGDESTNDETLNSAEQALLQTYLENGGQLFISGSEIGWDLDYKGGTADRQFYHDYLHADYVQDDAGIYQLSGQSGSIMAGLSFNFDDGGYGIYEEDYPDAINPRNGASACLNYSSSLHAGIQYEGPFGEGSFTGRLVYLAVPWETITTENDRQVVLRRIVEFFGIQTSSLAQGEDSVPATPFLSDGYPNPFNSRVNFKLHLDHKTTVSMGIYNNLGQQVLTSQYEPGARQVINLSWNGTNTQGHPVASGVYYIVVHLAHQQLVKPMVFLK